MPQPVLDFIELTAVRRQTTTKRSSKNMTIDTLKAGFWEDLPEKTAIKVHEGKPRLPSRHHKRPELVELTKTR